MENGISNKYNRYRRKMVRYTLKNIKINIFTENSKIPYEKHMFTTKFECLAPLKPQGINVEQKNRLFPTLV
jgi:hypothetical protein